MNKKLPVQIPMSVHEETPPMLINEISRLFASIMREHENEMIQESVRLIIISLSIKDNVTQLDLVHRTHLSPPTVSLTLKRLEKAGYVSRITDTTDQRAVRVHLTEKGRKLNRDSLKNIHNTDKIMMRGISDEESELLIPILRRMRDNMLEGLAAEGESSDK